MFNSIEEGIKDLALGKMIIVLDSEDRENEGDLVMAGEKVTGEAINFMATYGKGLICTPIDEAIANKLNFKPMTLNNTDNHMTNFTCSVDYKDTTTGISAFERALTIKKITEDSVIPNDFKKPGHVFPLIAKEGGVLKRQGHTEASTDLARLANLKPIGVICEILKENGEMMRRDDLIIFAKRHNLKIITIEDLIHYRKSKEILVSLEAKTNMPTKYGDFMAYAFVDKYSGEEHVALVKGDLKKDMPILTRIHSECLTGDVFHSMRCDCGEQFDYALKKISEHGTGVLVYMRQEGRGIGLVNKLKAYALQDSGLDTVEANLALGFKADLREYSVAASILKSLGATNLNLMTNNPRKIHGLEEFGIKISNRLTIQMNHNEKNRFYLETKKEKLNHMLL